MKEGERRREVRDSERGGNVYRGLRTYRFSGFIQDYKSENALNNIFNNLIDDIIHGLVSDACWGAGRNLLKN